MEKYIKLYTKMLDNPKTGKLKDRTWRIMIEVFLMAGETFDDGKLPDVEMIAWRLRRSEKDVRDALHELAKIGTVSLTEDNVIVTNFEEYQNTNQTAYERVKNYRKRHRDNTNDNADDNANDNGTDNANDNGTDNADDMKMITVDKDIDKDKDKDINSFSNEKEYTRAKNSQKRKFGSAKNVLLTDDEYAKLKARFVDADEKIENLSLGIASKGYKYKDHYATILNWARRDAEKQTAQPQKQPETTFGDIRNYFEAAETPQWDIDL